MPDGEFEAAEFNRLRDRVDRMGEEVIDTVRRFDVHDAVCAQRYAGIDGRLSVLKSDTTRILLAIVGTALVLLFKGSLPEILQALAAMFVHVP